MDQHFYDNHSMHDFLQILLQHLLFLNEYLDCELLCDDNILSTSELENSNNIQVNIEQNQLTEEQACENVNNISFINFPDFLEISNDSTATLVIETKVQDDEVERTRIRFPVGQTIARLNDSVD